VELSCTDKYAHRMKLLRGIPGIGILTGMEMLVELQVNVNVSSTGAQILSSLISSAAHDRLSKLP
jgi:hypothetical protein